MTERMLIQFCTGKVLSALEESSHSIAESNLNSLSLWQILKLHDFAPGCILFFQFPRSLCRDYVETKMRARSGCTLHI
jgi:hypothetical protein